ncbi:hypothetical protein [Psychroserpens sp.]|uniref:hypothetical protein n=1 Tax=Psychroserpens sp. TaxID=2020870 RepID=UPI002B27073F|nr:hypothetical protein [Psychroserpens sp.]
MKKFSYQIGIFVVILFIVNLLLFNLGNDLYYKNYDNHDLNYKSYLFSDSHGAQLKTYPHQYGVYNFSADSESYLDIQRKINFLIEHTALDTIYLSADEQMLSTYREKLNNADKSMYYATSEDFPNQFAYFKSQISQKVIYFQPKIGLVLRKYVVAKLENIPSLFETDQDRTNKTQSSLNWNDFTLDFKEEKVRNRLNNQFTSQKNSMQLQETLVDIIRVCKSNNIVLIGVKFPLTKAYYNVVKDQHFGVDSIFKANGLKVLNFQSLYINNDDLFVDVDHLNTKGGKKFTELLFKKH